MAKRVVFGGVRRPAFPHSCWAGLGGGASYPREKPGGGQVRIAAAEHRSASSLQAPISRLLVAQCLNGDVSAMGQRLPVAERHFVIKMI